jgi:hypothetical protein
MTVAACGSSNTNGSAPAATSSQTTLTTNASVPCDGQQGPNPAMPEFYQEQYSSGLADSLKRDLASYDAAVGSGDPQQTGTAAGTLYSEIKSDGKMLTTQTLFGCYEQAVLTGVATATDTFAPTLDDISSAAAGLGGKTPADVPDSLHELNRKRRPTSTPSTPTRASSEANRSRGSNSASSSRTFRWMPSTHR